MLAATGAARHLERHTGPRAQPRRSRHQPSPSAASPNGPTAHRSGNAGKNRHLVQQFLRIRHRQKRSRKQRAEFQYLGLERPRRRRSRKAAHFHARRSDEGRAARKRIYRHRCVEGWSIVVPWIGYPLSNIAKLVQADAKAKFVSLPELLRSEADAARPLRGNSAALSRRLCASTRP